MGRIDDIMCDNIHLASVAGIDDIMCYDITCEDLYLVSLAGMDNITCDDLTYDDLNPDCVRLWDGLTI